MVTPFYGASLLCFFKFLSREKDASVNYYKGLLMESLKTYLMYCAAAFFWCACLGGLFRAGEDLGGKLHGFGGWLLLGCLLAASLVVAAVVKRRFRVAACIIAALACGCLGSCYAPSFLGSVGRFFFLAFTPIGAGVVALLIGGLTFLPCFGPMGLESEPCPEEQPVETWPAPDTGPSESDWGRYYGDGHGDGHSDSYHGGYGRRNPEERA